MKTYDVRCPICGKTNRRLFLDETEGLMECEYCKHVSRSSDYEKQRLIGKRPEGRKEFRYAIS